MTFQNFVTNSYFDYIIKYFTSEPHKIITLACKYINATGLENVVLLCRENLKRAACAEAAFL